MKKKSFVLATLFTLASNGAAIAQTEIPAINEDSDIEEIELTVVEEILNQTIYAPFRQDVPLRESSRAAYVINREQIEAQGFRTVGEALRYLPGVFSDGVAGGQLGALSGQLIRGGKTAQTLILLDGRPINEIGFFGNFDLSKLTVNSLERIEVIPGGGSTLFGSNAIGGVINLVSRTTDFQQGLTGEVATDIGGHGFNQQNVAVRYGTERFAVSLGYDRAFATNEFDYDLESTDATGIRENASANINNLNFQATGKIGDRHTLKFSSYYLTKDLEIPGGIPVTVPGIFNSLTPNAEQYTDDLLLSLELQSQLNEANTSQLTARIFADFNDYSFRNPDGSFSKGDNVESSSIGGQIQHNLQLAANQKLTYGLDYRHVETTNETIRPCTSFDSFFNCLDFSGVNQNYEETINQTALFANYSVDFSPEVTANLGIRQDFNSLEDGSFTSPSAGILWRAGERTTLRANYARNFRVPNLIDLYYSGYSNPNLIPEKSDSFDIGIDQVIGDHALLRLTYFNNTINDAIVNGSTQPINVQKVRAQGLEAELNVQVTKNIYAFANYTLNDSEILENTNNLNEGNELRYAGTNLANLGIAYENPKGIYVGLFLKHVGDRFPTEANTDRLSSYTNVDLRARYPINERVNLTASWENIFDDNFEVSPGFPGVGSRFQVGVNASFR